MEEINPIDKQVGVNVRWMRVKKGMSREELGDRLSPPVSGTAIEKYEKGINRISASSLVLISKALKCQLADLFLAVDVVMKENGLNEDPESVRYEAELMHNFRQINHKGMQEAVANLCKAMVLSLTGAFTQEH